MSRFSESFDLALHQLGLTRREYSRASGLPEGQVSKYARGLIAAGSASLETIARSLPEPQRAMVVSAWLRDHTPECAQQLISISTPDGISFCEEEPKLVLSDDLERAINHLKNMAVKHREIADLLIQLSSALEKAIF